MAYWKLEATDGTEATGRIHHVERMANILLDQGHGPLVVTRWDDPSFRVVVERLNALGQIEFNNGQVLGSA